MQDAGEFIKIIMGSKDMDMGGPGGPDDKEDCGPDWKMLCKQLLCAKIDPSMKEDMSDEEALAAIRDILGKTEDKGEKPSESDSMEAPSPDLFKNIPPYDGDKKKDDNYGI